MEILHAYVGDIAKTEKTPDGLMVYGKATGPDLDKDQQICDPAWLRTAMPKWAEIGNVREMHGKIAAGVGVETEAKGDDWWVKSLCVDPITALKIEKGVLKGYSIGIKGGKVVKDAAAPGGRIVGGSIVELSYVDNQCNPTCSISMVKFEGDAADLQDADTSVADFTKLLGLSAEEIEKAPGDVLTTLDFIAKRDYSGAQRKALAAKGQALPGGGFPIANVDDLKNAISAIGRAKNPTEAKAHIKKRATALGKTDLLPASWKAESADITKATDDEWTHDPAQITLFFQTALDLLKAEIDEWAKGEDEKWDVQDLLSCASIIARWWKSEANEGEVPQPFTGGDTMDDAALISLGVDADIIKAAKATDATDDQKTAFKASVLKALGLDDDTIKSTITDTAKAIAEGVEKTLTERLESVEKLAAPGGPVKARTDAEAATATKADQMRSQAEYFRQTATTLTDPEMANAYRTKAVEADNAARDLEKVA